VRGQKGPWASEAQDIGREPSRRGAGLSGYGTNGAAASEAAMLTVPDVPAVHGDPDQGTSTVPGPPPLRMT